MRFKKSPQLPGAGRTRAGHHHGSHTPTSPGAILLSKMACQPKHFGRQCTITDNFEPIMSNFLRLFWTPILTLKSVVNNGYSRTYFQYIE